MSERLKFILGGLHLAVLERQFPQHFDVWDGNWLVVEAACVSNEASIKARGPFLRVEEFARLKQGLEAIYSNALTEWSLNPMEPNLDVRLKAGKRGDLKVTVSLTPEHMMQSHRLDLALDLTYLPPAIAQCEKVLEAYPARG